jgi:hypothetical protein
MSGYLLPTGVRFNDCFFSEPVRLAEWIPPGSAGILAILARDTNWAPKPFQPLYFTEFGNDARRSPESRGAPAGALGGNLYVAVLLMPFSTATQRTALRNELVAAYNPICQGSRTPSAAELARRVEEMEARHNEQHAQLLSLLTSLYRFFEPQPVGPRRPIGFLPQLAQAE